MVAVIADLLQEPDLQEHWEPLAEIVPFPGAPARAEKAADTQAPLGCWLIDERGAVGGYALDVSRAGACVRGVSARYQAGERLGCKLELGDEEPPLLLTCKIERVGPGELGVRFLELGFNEWERLARLDASSRAPTRAPHVLMPPA